MPLSSMRITKFAPAALAILGLLAAGCGSVAATAAPTTSVEALFTQAAETLIAQDATQAALRTPTAAASPSIFATVGVGTAAAPAAVGNVSLTPVTGDCLNAGYVSDLTIQDGETTAAGTKFTKTWSVVNSGTCEWTTAFKLGFQEGDQMGGAVVALPDAVQPGETVPVSVALTAPAAAGTYEGKWILVNDQGAPFGDFLSVSITVP